MIHETVIDESLNRLLTHFKDRVIVRPPASAAELAELEGMAGPLPRDLTIFYATCNGIRVHLESDPIDAHICCLHELERTFGDFASPAAAGGLALLRGHPDETGDWLVLKRCPAYGNVIRWNPWAPGAALLASCLGQYLQAWVTYLIDCFDHHGLLRRDRIHPRFDARYAAQRDPELSRLQKNPQLLSWLHELDLVVPSGDDFE